MNTPSTLAVEKEVLSLLLNSSDFFCIAEGLNEECFSNKNYLCIYKLLKTLYEKNGSYDFISVIDFFDEINPWEDIGDRESIISLYGQSLCQTKNIKDHIKLLRDYALKRSLISATTKITELALDPTLNVETIIYKINKRIKDCFSLKGETDISKVDSLTGIVTAYIERGDGKGISTGFRLLDRLLGGFKPSKLYIIAARTAMGKTNLAVFFSLKIAQESKYPVVFFSAEMSTESLSIRFIASLSGVDSGLISSNRMSYEERAKFKEGLEKFSQLNLIIDQTPAAELSAAKISSVLHAVVNKYGGISAVFVDYIQLLGDYRVSRRDLAIGEMSRAFKDYSKLFNTPFISLAQVKREVEIRSDKRPKLSDLKDSGQLEQDSDAIITVYRDEYYNENTESPDSTELAVVKNRDGSTGKIDLSHDLAICKYEEPKTFALGLRGGNF